MATPTTMTIAATIHVATGLVACPRASRTWRDDGVGVHPDAMGTLFTRFSHGQSHTATAGRQRHGIGLALVREIALAHRGDIAVTPTVGGGATFTLTVPAAPSP